MAGSITATALKGAKSAFRFIEGSWGKSVGEAYRKAHLANPNIGITTFNWGKAYRDHFANAAKAAAEAASKPAATGFWASIKNGLGKIPGLKFIGRNIGPILIVGPMILSAFKELFNGGGIGGAMKELTKGAIGWSGWGIGTMIAAACGATGAIIPFLAGIVMMNITEWIAKKALGPSTSEIQEAQLAKQKEFQQQALPGYNPSVNVDDITRDVRQIENLFNSRNKNNPFLGFQSSNYPTAPNRKCFVA